jgi:hypothetical protein
MAIKKAKTAQPGAGEETLKTTNASELTSLGYDKLRNQLVPDLIVAVSSTNFKILC